MFEFDQYLGFLLFLTILTIGFWLMFFLVGFVPYWIGGALMELYKEKKAEKEAQKAEGAQSKALAKARLLAAGELLGLLQCESQVWFQGELQSDTEAARFDALIAERQAARMAKNYGRSDEIRKEFADAGVVIEDTAAGARWRRI